MLIAADWLEVQAPSRAMELAAALAGAGELEWGQNAGIAMDSMALAKHLRTVSATELGARVKAVYCARTERGDLVPKRALVMLCEGVLENTETLGQERLVGMQCLRVAGLAALLAAAGTG